MEQLSPPPRGSFLASPLGRWVVLAAWNAWQRLDALLPRRIRFTLATVVGEGVYWLLRNKRAAALDNMAHVLGPDAPPERVRLAAKRTFHNYVKYLTEFAHLPRWTDRDLDSLLTDLDGLVHIEDALRDGKGAIIVSPHFGNWDVAGWLFGRRWTFAAVAEPLTPPELDALVEKWRRSKPMGFIPLATAARSAMRILQRGGIVALMVDRPTHATAEGITVRFFGAPTRVPAGAAHFALRTGAPVVVGGVWRTPQNRYTPVVFPPLRFTTGGRGESDVQAAMQRIMADLETLIRSHPDQWYMFRRMWPEPVRRPRPAHRWPRRWRWRLGAPIESALGVPPAPVPAVAPGNPTPAPCFPTGR
jgi:KDO2-lipid IV(A) lauroyltransferase